LKGLENNNDDVAINIKLKSGKNKFWFGDISAGTDFVDRLLSTLSCFITVKNKYCDFKL
jgi:hypothetical protein